MRIRRRPTLVAVLLLAIGGVAVGAIVLVAALTLGLARLAAPELALEQLSREAERIADVARGLPCDESVSALAALRREFGSSVRFFDEESSAPRAALARTQGQEGRTVWRGGPAYYAAKTMTLCGRGGTLYVFEPAAEAEVLPRGFVQRLALAVVSGLAGAALLAVLLARRISRPLHDLARSARAVARDEPESVEPVAATDAAEIADLKEAFGDMVSDLNSARDQQKAFLLSVSHELRTPLTAIRGYGEALTDGTAQEPARAGEVIVRESQRLSRLVQDLLDLARLESGEFSVRPETVDLEELTSSSVDALRPAADVLGVRLRVTANGTAPAVETDPDRVHQMIANLLENAMRVTPEGETVVVEVGDRSVAIRDVGPGIAPEDIDHAFERFYLWRRYRGVRPVGSGLGLAVVGELAQRLGVQVVVESEDGAGSRFELRFPA